jgi:uncharacterized protein
MTIESLIDFGSASIELSPLPVRASWILEGAPVAHAKIISRSTDGTSKTVIWDCTAGRFNWSYDIDETVYVLEGSALITDQRGTPRRVSAGDTILFRAGAQAEWTVDRHIRKIAFLRNPMPKYALLAIKIVRAVKKLTGLAHSADAAGSMAEV